ncbi:hypothetical protein IEO21_07505 [Rhodonia placenta]|uniref:Uncharacterized protein n=1 Tax=Rhodonia placenta TaxID=104341 RepID=A0A8H7TZQ2_9APHY|nr:hypothetical protein IEO21_07505 [Postia placenta]
MSYICPNTLGLAPCAQLLFRTENLRELQICKLEGLLQHEPRYGDAILALKHLVSVKFTGAGPLALNLISRLSSSVRNVVLFLEPGTMTWHDLLSQFRPTPNVQKLELCHVRWLPSEEDVFSGPLPQPRKGDGITACWPNVRTLNLLRGAVPMHICARVFPGLRNLAVSEKSLWTTSCDNSNWQVLDRVSTIPRSLLPTTIRSVHHLRLLLVEYTENLLLSIEKVSPAILSLRSDSAIDHIFWRSLMQRAPNLRCLDVVVECESERQETPEDYLLWLLDLANALAATRVMCVRIRFNKAEGWDVAPLRAHLSRFIATAKPVRYLSAECGSVVFRGHEDDLCGWRRWWRAQNTPGGRVLKDMSFEVGEELLEKLCDARLFKTMDLDGTFAIALLLSGSHCCTHQCVRAYGQRKLGLLLHLPRRPGQHVLSWTSASVPRNILRFARGLDALGYHNRHHTDIPICSTRAFPTR